MCVCTHVCLYVCIHVCISFCDVNAAVKELDIDASNVRLCVCVCINVRL